MRREVQAIVLLLVGGALLRISLGDIYLNYVKESMRPWLIASGAVLILLGLVALVDILRVALTPGDDPNELHDPHELDPHELDEPDPHDPVDEHGHAHSGGPRSAWLLLLPVFAIFLIAPPALGAYAAARDTTNGTKPQTAHAPALPPGDPVTITVSDFVSRAVWDDGITLADRNVSMTGFVTPNPAGGWWLTRLAISCCAADAITSKIVALDTPDLPANTWVTVTGHWVPGGGTKSDTAVPLVEVTDVEQVPAPENPYE